MRESLQHPLKPSIIKIPDPRMRRLKWIAVEFLYAATVIYLMAGALYQFPAKATRVTLSLGIAALTVGVILQIVNRKGSIFCRGPMALLLTGHLIALALLIGNIY